MTHTVTNPKASRETHRQASRAPLSKPHPFANPAWRRRRRALLLAVTGALGLGAIGAAGPGDLAELGIAIGMGRAEAAGEYPTRPVRVIVPFTPGSGTDGVARAVGDPLGHALGQPFVVENRPGAGGTLGASQVATANGDGQTVLVHSAGHAANAALYKLRYDTLKDFAPITMLATLPNVLVTAATGGFASVQDLVAKARAQPGKYLYASAGNGSATHINAEKFRVATGIEAEHVPFKGTPEAMTEVMAGRIDWFFAPLISTLPMIREGRLKALAVGTPERSAALPDVPTTVEAGFPGSDYTFWVGLFVPAKTPAAIIERLSSETVKALRTDAIRDRFAAVGAVPAPMTPAAFGKRLESEVGEATGLIRAAGIKIQ